MNRNIIHTLWMAGALPVLLASCQQDELPDMNGASDTTPLFISVTDGGYASTDKAATRAAENGYRTEFTAGDACGLYIVRSGTVIYDNVKLTAIAGTDGNLTWQPAAGVTLGGGLPDEQYFLYYPYQKDMTDKTTASATNDAEIFFAPLIRDWTPKADQSNYAAYTASDLMTAQGTAAKTDGKLSLSFSMTHRMALAVIEMPKTVYKFTDNTDGLIPDYTAMSSVDFTDSSVQPYGIAPGTYRCIVNPAQSTSLRGLYNKGKKEFAFTPNCSAGSYKTYKIDGGHSEKQATLQMGDYFCKDSDNNWYIIPQETTPDDNVIGIVFHVGQHDSDKGDYASTGIGQQKCHGYVVALTDVHNDKNDRLRWEWGPTQQYDSRVNASTSTTDWQGYSNSLKFHKFVNKHSGWEIKHFPAALACETYGKRTLDHYGNDANGKYDWQQPLAAPSNTSGWFLPSYGQLLHLYANRSLLSARMTDVKNSTPADCIYRDKIKWFSTSLFYWSSTEYPYDPSRAWRVSFYYGDSSNTDKDYTYDVRAVLAF